MTHAYGSEDFDPPAPVAYVTLKSSDIEIHNAPMLMDTGADVSLPRHGPPAFSASRCPQAKIVDCRTVTLPLHF
jgi:hypothetical protein